MNISRRAFLDNAIKIGAIQSVPAPLLRLQSIIGKVPLVGAAVELTETAAGLSSVDLIAGTIASLNSSWTGLYDNFDFANICDPDKSAPILHDVISRPLNEHLAQIFLAFSQFRHLRVLLFTGDEQSDRERLLLLSQAVEIKKQMHTSIVKNLADQFFEEDCDWQGGVQRINPMVVAELNMWSLAQTAKKIRKNPDCNIDKSLRTIKSEADGFIKLAQKVGKIDDGFGAEQRDLAKTAIEELCRQSGVSPEIVDAFTTFLPDLQTVTFEGLEEAEFYELFDDKILFKGLANMVGAHADNFLSCFNNYHGASLTAETVDYVMTRLEKNVQDIYRQHFVAAMPEIADMPLPNVSAATAEYFKVCEAATAESGIEVEAVESESAIVDAIAEASATSTDLGELSYIARIGPALSNLIGMEKYIGELRAEIESTSPHKSPAPAP